MTKTHWNDDLNRAADLFTKEDYNASVKIFEDICARPELSPTERSYMFLNLATNYERLKRYSDADKALDDAGDCALQNYLFVEQSRAVYLIRVGRSAEAVPLIEQILRNKALSADGRAACEENLNIARQYAKSGGVPSFDVPPSVDTAKVRYTEAPQTPL